MTAISALTLRESAASRAETLGAALLALSIGALTIFLIGFAHSDLLHNAAHDSRHALSFPCH